jgi:hypothetical protein
MEMSQLPLRSPSLRWVRPYRDEADALGLADPLIDKEAEDRFCRFVERMPAVSQAMTIEAIRAESYREPMA